MARAPAHLMHTRHPQGQRLEGGWVSSVTRIGSTVRRIPPLSSDRPFVEGLLLELEAAGFDAAPRFIGIDGHGRQVLSYLSGYVPSSPAPPPPGIGDEESLVGVVRILRRLHDLTERADGRVAVHGDMAPRNTVYRDDGRGFRPVALIDWDQAHLGERVYDIAYAGWQFLDLGATWVRAYPEEAARRFRLMATSYGLSSTDRSRLVDIVIASLDRGWRGILDGATRDVTMRRLKAAGVAAAIRENAAWMSANRAIFDAVLARRHPAPPAG